MYVGNLMFGVMPLLILSMWMNNVCAIRYELWYGWNTTKNWPPNSPITGLEGTYRPLLPYFGYGNVNETMISSGNGMFCVAMYQFSTNSEAYYLTVVMGCNTIGAGVPVWIANRDSPCGSDYVFQVLKNGSDYYYELYDTRTRCWGSLLGLGDAELTNSGNWVLYDRLRAGAMKWQSFDDPTDVLLPGQNLAGDLRLSSRANSSTPQQGSFSAFVEQNRLVLYLYISNQPELYYKYPSTSSCASSNANATVIYQGHSLQLLYDEASGCSPVEIKSFGSTNSDGMNYLRLSFDGNVVSYTFDAGNWSSKKFFDSKCDLPNSCGAYGFCTQEKCQCLSTKNLTVEDSSLKALSLGGCSALNVTPAPCDQNLERNNHFVDVQGYTYFSSGYIDGIRNIPEKRCRDYCLSNCSCNAYVYGNAQCFLIDQVVGSFKSSPNMSSYLKFRNNNIRSGSLPSDTKKIKAVIIGMAAAAFVIICLTLAMLKVLKRKPVNFINKEINKSLARIDGLPPRFTYQEMEVATEGFSKKLGRGGFGSVYKGMLKNGKQVAVKRLEGTSQGAKEFLAEVATMATIRHVNIVRLCGFCIENNEQMLVYDFMSNGSLDQWLFADKEPLSWEVRVQIAIGMAKGLAYLHQGCSEPILHLDVKPQNILLDEKFEAKVADFGLARQVERDASGVVTCVRGTAGYMAPEWVMHSIATKKCDVYSFGMMLLEMIGGRKNMDNLKKATPLEWYFPAWAVEEVKEGRTMEVIDPKIRDFVCLEQGFRLVHVAFWCIQQVASLRPSMEEVVQMLEGLKEVEEPPLSFHFPVHTQSIVSFSTKNSGISVSRYEMESVSMSYVNDSQLIMIEDVNSLIR